MCCSDVKFRMLYCGGCMRCGPLSLLPVLGCTPQVMGQGVHACRR